MAKPSVDIKGIFTVAHLEQIKRQGYSLLQAAQNVLLGDDFFEACLVCFADDRYKIYGSGTGPHFPIGSKMLLADLPFELVDDRFEAPRVTSQQAAEFESFLRKRMQTAISGFSTDLHD